MRIRDAVAGWPKRVSIGRNVAREEVETLDRDVRATCQIEAMVSGFWILAKGADAVPGLSSEALAPPTTPKESAGIKQGKTLMMRPKPGAVRQQTDLASIHRDMWFHDEPPPQSISGL